MRSIRCDSHRGSWRLWPGQAMGGVAGGWLLKHEGRPAVFVGCAAVLLLWLIIAWSMKAPPARKQEAGPAVAA